MQILDDLKIATPSKAKSLEDQRAQIANSIFSLTLLDTSTSMNVTDDASMLFTQQIIAQQGFGKLLKCIQEAKAH